MKRVLGVAIAAAVVAFTMEGGAQSSLPLVQPGELVWQGAFRLPAGQFGPGTYDQFGYGGWALAYNAANSSLYVVGHDYGQHVAEVSIPKAVAGNTLGQLPFAKVLQPFVDVTEGRMSKIGGYPNYKMGGLLVFGGQLIAAMYSYFDAGPNYAVASHFAHDSNLANSGGAGGPFRVGTLNPGFYGGNMANIPGAFQASLKGQAVTGQCCLAIVGRTSYGPSAFAFDPSKLGTVNPTPVVPLLYYPSTNPLQQWQASNTNQYNGSSEMAGSLIPEGTRSLLFIGRQGTGPFCYRCGTPDPYCRGDVHAPPYQVQVWAYDLNDLTAVAKGRKQPWQPRPYAIWALTGNTAGSPLPFFTSCMSVRGLAYDATSQRLWIAAQGADDGARPVIHEFHMVPGAAKVPPEPVSSKGRTWFLNTFPRRSSRPERVLF
jgi:hypothetical protein